MGSFFEKLYEKLWRHVGGKPWTEIIREDEKRTPLLYMFIFLGLGILLARFTGKYWWQLLLGFIPGVLCGHLFW